MTETEFRDHPAIDWLNKLARRIADASSIMACMVLLWLVGLTCVDVVGRYFFNSPLVGATELVQMSMAGIIFFSMPAIILTVGATWIVAGRVGKYALRALEDGDETIYLKIPVYLTVMLITALLYLSCVFAAIRGLRALLRPGKTLPDETGGQPIGD
jgi:TRAP-type mannitol/chloroaromatic compound transport system permease small subunit